MDHSPTINSNKFWDDFSHSAYPNKITSIEIIHRFRAFSIFFHQLPKSELIKRGWLSGSNDMSSLASIFFDLSPINNCSLFRKSASAREPLLVVWLSKVKLHAEQIYARQMPEKFDSLNKSDLRQLAQLSPDPLIIKSLPEILAKLGVILIYLPALSGMKADGAVFKINSGNPVVALSLRFPRLDNFWFTLMHELAHLVLHADLLNEAIVVDLENDDESTVEKSANRVAKEAFVDRISWRNCEPKYQSNDDSVVRYAESQGIHPSIVAGMLRRESGDYRKYSSIINKHNVKSILESHD